MYALPIRGELFAALLIVGAILLAPAPGGAQENPLFFGVWEPASTSAGGFPLTFEPGRITFWNKDELDWDQRFEVIKDFGDRIVVKMWTVKVKFEYPLNKPSLRVFSIRRTEYNDGSSRLGLSYDYCSSDQAHKYFFETNQPDEIWQRILAWSARRSEGFPYDHCSLNEEDGLPDGWSGMGFARPDPADE